MILRVLHGPVRQLLKPLTLVAGLVAGLAACPLALGAQDTTRTTPQPVLPAVRVTATREGPRSPLELPYAITIVRPDSLASLRRLGVDELLFTVPGIALANRQNPAQDPRVSIRGFGARSAFGVRGVRVLQDGVPVTLPDGQTPVDNLDLESASRVEVVRGSTSSLYGNAAGGVIDVRSALPPAPSVAPYGRIVGGNDSPTVSAVGAAGTLDQIGYTSSLTRVVGRGYRDFSDQRATRGALRLLLMRPESSATTATLAARFSDVTHAENPGALTRAQFGANPRMADPLSVQKQAGKTVRQGDLALTVDRALSAHGALNATLYGSARTLANPLTFGTVDVDRRSGGGSVRLNEDVEIASRLTRFAAGADVQWQHDDRRQHANCADARSVTATCPSGASLRGVLQRDQLELVSSVGPFVRAEVPLTSALLVSAGARADAVRFQVRDHLVSPTNPDDSGDRTLRAFSPSAGLVWKAASLASLYANASTSFETPTTTELGNSPDGSAGFNPDLQPQRTMSVELGTKGFVPLAGIRWDAALFQSRVRDELVPFSIPNGAGRVFYRNAGRTLRRGGELGVQADAGPLGFQAAYTYSHFRYLEYQVGSASYAGNRIPGVPAHALRSAMSVRNGDLTLSATADVASAMDVDDANSEQAPGRTIFGVSLGSTVHVAGTRLSPLVAVQNLTGVRSVGSVSINAAGGKFYEPAPGRTLLVRVALARDLPDRP
jgi:iron complex outermembrane receptor protein